MNKVFKLFSICLAALLMMTLMSMSALAKRPDGFNEARLWNKSSLGSGFILEIGDMDFRGYLTIAGGSEQFLDDMIEQVLDEMGLSEGDLAAFEGFIDNLFGKQYMTDNDWDTVTVKLSDKLGISFDELVAAIGAIDTASKTGWEDAGWHEQGSVVINDYLSSDSEVAKKLNDYLGNSGKSSTDLFGDLSNFKEAYDKWQSFDPHDPDYQLGMDAFKRREEYYKRLNDKIENALKDGDGEYYYAIVFRNATCERLFEFFSGLPEKTKFIEKWTLNMALSLNGVGERTSAWNPIASGNSYAEFLGPYTIEIEYKVENLHNVLEASYRYAIIDRKLSILEKGETWFASADLTNPGEKRAKRTLAGEAIAQVRMHHEGDGNYNIIPMQKRDEKDVFVTDVVMKCFEHETHTFEDGPGYTCTRTYDIVITADAQIFYTQWKSIIEQHSEHGTVGPVDDKIMPNQLAFWGAGEKGTMYWRGDHAKDNWKLFGWN